MLFSFLSVLIAIRTEPRQKIAVCRRFIWEICAYAADLAFLPAKDVIKGFELRKDCNGDSDVSEFLEYFEKTYIGVPQQIGTGRRAPRFAVSEWSVYKAVMDRKSKTNNNVEVWNRIFNNAVNVKHPNIPKLISHFKDLQNDAELKVEKINAGEDISLKKRKLEHIHKRVEALMLNYDTGETDITNFSSETAHNLAI